MGQVLVNLSPSFLHAPQTTEPIASHHKKVQAIVMQLLAEYERHKYIEKEMQLLQRLGNLVQLGEDSGRATHQSFQVKYVKFFEC